jgi:hypothetical protein
MKNKITLLLLLVLTTYTGCKKDFLESTDPNKLTTEKFYKTSQDAIQATNSVYSALNIYNMYMREYWYVLDLMSDEIEGTANLEPRRQQVGNYTMTPNNDLITSLWSGLYMGINRANLAIENIPAIPMDETQKERLLAECRFLRGFYYFELTTLYGAAPLITKPIIDAYSFPRTPVAEIDPLIEEDFKFAISILPKKAEYPASDLGRATQGAAKGLLGKFYLYKKRYAEAAAVLKEIIDSGEYDLVDNYRDNGTHTNENNKESLFEVQMQTGIFGGNSWGNESAGTPNGEGSFRTVEYGLTGFNNVKGTQQFIDLMGDDPRSKYTFYQYGTTIKTSVGGSLVDTPYQDFKRDAEGNLILDANGKKQAVNGYATRKYNMLDFRASEFDESGDSGINFRVLRFADVLLMYAEAVNEVNGPTADVYAAVNRVRNRPSVKVGDLPAGLSKADMFNAIVRERALEFPLEQIRGKDIRRWGIAGPILRAQGKQYRDGVHELLPIPQKEIDANAAIGPEDQNPGY